MTTKRPLDRIGGLKKPTAAADEPAVLDLGRVDAAVEPVASRRGFFRGLMNSGVAAGAASTLVGCGGGGGDATRSTTGSLCTRTYRRPIAHADFVTVLAYSPDGTRIASASFDTTVKVWDVASGNLLLIFRGHTRNVEALAFSRSGALLVSAAGASAKVWRVADGAELFDLATPGGNVQAVAVSPDDSSVVTAARVATGGAPDAALVRVWSLASGTLALTTALANQVALAVEPSSGRVLSTDGNGNAALWSVITGAVTFTRAATFSPLGVSPISTRMASRTGARIEVWDTTHVIAQSASFGTSAPSCLDFSPEGARIAAVNGRDQLLVLDAATGFTLRSIAGAFRCVAFSPDGTRVVTGGSTDRSVRIWHVGSGTEDRVFTDPAISPLVSETTSDCSTGGSTVQCTCDTVCTCNTVCTCDTVTTCTCDSQGGHYWYPN